MASKNKITVILAALVVFGATFMSTGTALADTSSSCSTGVGGNVTCVQQLLNQEGTATDSTSVAVKAASNGKAKVTLLVAEHYVSAAQMREAQKSGNCHMYAKIWNSGFVDGKGKLGWKIDHHVYGCLINGKLYKEGGGVTGEACGNLLKLLSEPPRPSSVHAEAKFVARMRWKATAHVTATVPVTVGISVSVHNADNSCQSSGSGQATAEGTATATATATATSKAGAQASAEGKAVELSGGLKQEASVHASAEAKASATAQASAKATCSPTTSQPPPPAAICTDKTATNYGGSLPCQYPPTPVCTDETATNYGGSLPCQYPGHWTQISCTGFEEVTEGGSFAVDCDVADDNGAPISLVANANNANVRVSGINCFSQGGTPSCSGDGTFEFRVNGVSQGTSSITATATANGVSTTFTSDPFPVDPKEGGFARKVKKSKIILASKLGKQLNR